MWRWDLDSVAELPAARAALRSRLGGVGIPAEDDASGERLVLAFDELEHQIRLPGRRDAGVDEVSDMRMGEFRQEVAFASKPLFARPPDQCDVQQLDGGASLEAAVATLGEPHAAHPALADRRNESVGAEDLPLERRRFGGLVK